MYILYKCKYIIFTWIRIFFIYFLSSLFPFYKTRLYQ